MKITSYTEKRTKLLSVLSNGIHHRVVSFSLYLPMISMCLRMIISMIELYIPGSSQIRSLWERLHPRGKGPE